jgi:hypothetical protein
VGNASFQHPLTRRSPKTALLPVFSRRSKIIDEGEAK